MSLSVKFSHWWENSFLSERLLFRFVWCIETPEVLLDKWRPNPLSARFILDDAERDESYCSIILLHSINFIDKRFKYFSMVSGMYTATTNVAPEMCTEKILNTFKLSPTSRDSQPFCRFRVYKFEHVHIHFAELDHGILSTAFSQFRWFRMGGRCQLLVRVYAHSIGLPIRRYKPDHVQDNRLDRHDPDRLTRSWHEQTVFC